ncbi:Pyridoxal 4-dehydrogenase [compost metagenome]
METVAQSAGTTLAAAALHFPLRNPLVVSVLIGTAKPSSLLRNVELFDQTIAEAAWSQFEEHAIGTEG